MMKVQRAVVETVRLDLVSKAKKIHQKLTDTDIERLKQIERGCPKQTRRVHAFRLKSMERLAVSQFAEAVRLAVLVRMAS